MPLVFCLPPDSCPFYNNRHTCVFKVPCKLPCRQSEGCFATHCARAGSKQRGVLDGIQGSQRESGQGSQSKPRLPFLVAPLLRACEGATDEARNVGYIKQLIAAEERAGAQPRVCCRALRAQRPSAYAFLFVVFSISVSTLTCVCKSWASQDTRVCMQELRRSRQARVCETLATLRLVCVKRWQRCVWPPS